MLSPLWSSVQQRAVLPAVQRRMVSFSLEARKHASGQHGRVCAVLGAQWGDEGKGKLADVLAKDYDLVCRFNGGTNAGHTVVVGGKKFAFHLLPCGLIYPHTVNVLGHGTVVDLEAMFEELAPLAGEGIHTSGRLLVSDRAHLLFGYHKVIDGLMEERRAAGGGSIIGTTRKGIGPAYASKANRTGIRVGQLKHMSSFRRLFRRSVEQLQMLYDFEYDIQDDLDKLEAMVPKVEPMIVDSVAMVNQYFRDGKKIITEGANALMLDLDYGTYPFVTSSTTAAGGITTGLGLSPDKVDTVMGVAKAYTTRVGSGPFPTELSDDRSGGDRPHGAPGSDIGLHMQEVGFEFGVTTGRKRRCGWLDAVVLQYSHMLNNYSGINLTKLDVLDELEEVRIGVAYTLHGQELPLGSMPATLEDLSAVEVVYETMPGWQASTAHCRTFEDLPPAARAYVTRIEELVNCPVSWVGVGVGRDEMVTRFE